MQWSTSTAGCLLLALSSLGAHAGDAARLRPGSVDILIDQQTPPGQWTLMQPGSTNVEATGRLDDNVPVVLDPGRVARFAVVNGIPALFDYSLELKEPVPTENFKTAVAFLEKLAPLGVVTPPTGEQAQGGRKGVADQNEKCASYAKVDLCALRDRTELLLKFKEDASAALTSAMHADTSNVALMKSSLRHTVSELRLLVKTIDQIDEFDMAASRGSGAPSLAEFATTRKLESERAQSRAALAIFERRTDIKGAIEYAAKFTIAYQQTFEKRYLGKPSAPIAYNAANDLPAQITVDANRDFVAVFPPDTAAYQDKRTGTYKITIKPLERLSLKLGAGVLYSFVRDPQFSAAADDAGQLTIAKTEDDYAKFDGAVVLNITSADWQLFGAHPFVQVGVAPSSDKLAILAGAGLQLFDQGAISLGAIYQRVHRLAPDLAEGDVIAKPEDLRTEREFKAGFYLMLSMTLK